jgi:hypothetical protein
MAAIVQACEGEGGGGKVFSVHGGRWLVLKRFFINVRKDSVRRDSTRAEIFYFSQNVSWKENLQI